MVGVALVATRGSPVVLASRIEGKGGAFMASRTEVAKAGISFGTALAITISWTAHRSLMWACIHGVLGWFYVVYYVLTR